MMEGWEEVRLDDIANVIMGLSPKGETYNNNQNGTPLLNGPTEFGETYPNCTLFTIDPKRICKKNDLIFCVRGSTTGRMNWADHSYALGRGVCSITGIDDLTTKFIKHLLTINLPALLQITGGGTFPNLRKEDINGFKFKIPANYRKIASILSAYDDLIENNLKRIKLLEEKAQLTYEEWFVRMRFSGHEKVKFNEESGLPEGWEKKSLDKVADINSNSLKNRFKGVIEYIDIASVAPGRIESTTKYDYTEAPGRAKRIVKHGDIIWSCVRPNRKSHSVIWKPTKHLIASTGFCVISPKLLPTSYLLQYVTTNDFVAYLTNRAGGAAYPAVKAIDFKDADIIVPTEELVKKYDSIFDNSLELSWSLQNQNRLLKEARDILLPRLITGMVNVDELNLRRRRLFDGAENSEKYEKTNQAKY